MPFLGPSSELSLQTTPRKSWGAKKQLLLALAEGGESNHSDTHPQPSPSQRPAAQNLVSEPGGKVFLTLKASSFSVSQGLGKGRSQLQMEIPPHYRMLPLPHTPPPHQQGSVAVQSVRPDSKGTEGSPTSRAEAKRRTLEEPEVSGTSSYSRCDTARLLLRFP